MTLQNTFNSSGFLRSNGPAGFVMRDPSASLYGLGAPTKTVDQVFQNWNKRMAKFQKVRLRPAVVSAMEALVSAKENVLDDAQFDDENYDDYDYNSDDEEETKGSDKKLVGRKSKSKISADIGEDIDGEDDTESDIGDDDDDDDDDYYGSKADEIDYDEGPEIDGDEFY